MALPSSLCTFYVPFPPPPIRPLQFPPFPRGACLCLRGDCGRGGRGPDLHRGGKGAELPQRIPQGVWAADSPCVIIVLLGDARSNVSFNRSTLAIQEGRDSFRNSECADDVGYVNKENKSRVFFFLARKCMKCMWPVAKMASFHIWPTPARGNVKPYAGLKCLCSCLVWGILDYGRLDWTLPAVPLLPRLQRRGVRVCQKSSSESHRQTAYGIIIISNLQVMDVAGDVFSRPLIALDANIPNIKKKRTNITRHSSLVANEMRHQAVSSLAHWWLNDWNH